MSKFVAENWGVVIVSWREGSGLSAVGPSAIIGPLSALGVLSISGIFIITYNFNLWLIFSRGLAEPQFIRFSTNFSHFDINVNFC
jgi:hypothetical protein